LVAENAQFHEHLLALPLEIGVIVMPLEMGVSERLRGKELMSLGASGRNPPGGVRPGERIVMGGGTKTVRT